MAELKKENLAALLPFKNSRQLLFPDVTNIRFHEKRQYLCVGRIAGQMRLVLYNVVVGFWMFCVSLASGLCPEQALQTLPRVPQTFLYV